jgi:hypothetical protein
LVRALRYGKPRRRPELDRRSAIAEQVAALLELDAPAKCADELPDQIPVQPDWSQPHPLDFTSEHCRECETCAWEHAKIYAIPQMEAASGLPRLASHAGAGMRLWDEWEDAVAAGPPARTARQEVEREEYEQQQEDDDRPFTAWDDAMSGWSYGEVVAEFGEAFILTGPRRPPETISQHYVRVYELARILGQPCTDVITQLRQRGEWAKHHLSLIARPVAREVLAAFDKHDDLDVLLAETRPVSIQDYVLHHLRPRPAFA